MAKRTDANQADIVALYRKMGCSVMHCHTLGQGAPDLVVGCMGTVNDLVELKDGTKPKSRRQLTTLEKAFHNMWRGPIVVIESEAHVIGHVHEMRQRAGR